MTAEPEYIRQTVVGAIEQRMDWFEAAAREAREEGMTFFRYSYHPDNPCLLLIEGWRGRPKDQGDIRWQLVPSTQRTPRRVRR